MRARLILALIVLGAALTSLPAFARIEPLVIDLSESLVAVHPRFAGTELLLFGAVDEPGDVVVVLRGPEAAMVMRRKKRVAGIWVNSESVVFARVPRFYVVAATRPLEELADLSLLEENHIGIQRVPFRIISKEGPSSAEEFHTALVSEAEASRLYVSETARVEFLAERLFRAEFVLPARIPTGQYTVQAYLLRDGRLIASRSKSLEVKQIGFGAGLSRFAHDFPPFYGLLAIALALMAGWLGSVFFRKRALR
jgi:uncharacterized protein (TIGR02186 family)